MKHTIKLLFFCLLLLASTSLLAQQANYDATITVSIPDQDTVFARNNAFLSLKRQILIDAIKDQIGTLLFEEHSGQIMRHKDIKTSDLVSAYQILQEYTIGEKFTMKLQGTIRLDLLKEVLGKMNLVLKDDPWYNIGLVFDNNLQIPLDELQEKLDLFHLKINNYFELNTASIQNDDHGSLEFQEMLFTQYPDNQILFFIELEKAQDPETTEGLRVRIFRKADFKQINSFSIKFKESVSNSRANHHLQSIKNRFISAFSIQSCKRFLYDEGLESYIDIEVSGLSTPLEQYEFEKRIINQNQAIQSFSLKSFSKDFIEYELYSKYTIARLLDYFEAEKDGFDLFVEMNGINRLNIYAVYKADREVVELDSWPMNNRLIQKINEELVDTAETSENIVPEIEEKEPNNNSRKFNFLPNETLLIGKISSRADEDIYQVEELEEGKSSLNIEWLIASKTSLSPQLKLYDSEFRFLNSYSLLGHQKRLKFSYTFRDNTPKRIYIRVSDAVGFIQGEPGGYKSYDYLLKVGWN